MNDNKKIMGYIKYFLPYFLILIVSILLIGFQIKVRAVLVSGDTIFHWNRFYDIAKQLETKNFNYFQMNYSFNQSGRVINALYGPLFALMNGILLLITGSWFKYQIVSDLILLCLAGVGMYRLILKVNKSQAIATIISLIFINIGSVQTWIDESNFNAWGSALAPFALICAVDMLNDKTKPIHWIKLMIIMTILAQIHVLSTVMIAITLIPFAIIGLIKSKNKSSMLKDLLKSIIGTIILTANVWGAYLVLFRNNQLSLPNSMGMAAYSLHLNQFRTIRFSIMLCVLYLFTIQLIYILFHFKESILNSTVTIWGYFILIISSQLFPWNMIQNKFPVLGRSFQFPFRFTIVAFPLLLLGVALTINNINKTKITHFLIISFLGLVAVENFVPNIQVNRNLTQRYLDPNQVISGKWYSKVAKDRMQIQIALHDKDLSKILLLVDNSTPDYLPVHSKKMPGDLVGNMYVKQVIDKQQTFKHTVLRDGSLKVTWNNKNQASQCQIPIILYQESKLMVNGKTSNSIINKTKINAPIVRQKIGKNSAILSFNQPNWFNILLIITLIGWLGLIIYGIYYFLKFKIQKS